MKHNPRLNEKMARLPGFADVHPLQPQSTVQGAIEVMDRLAHWLKTLTGMPAVALSPKAGAHGELCGLPGHPRAAHEGQGQGCPQDGAGPDVGPRHQPGDSGLLRLCRAKRIRPDGRRPRGPQRPGPPSLVADIAAIMVTNPNTCGLFEREVIEIARLGPRGGGLLLLRDRANFNAIVGRVRPADLGVDAMHINLHKTFSTPHGGGGPGAGPVVLSEGPWPPFAPAPWIVHGSRTATA